MPGLRCARTRAMVCGSSDSSRARTWTGSRSSRNSNDRPAMVTASRFMTAPALSLPKEAVRRPSASSRPPRALRRPLSAASWKSARTSSATSASTDLNRTISAAMSSASISLNCDSTAGGVFGAHLHQQDGSLLGAGRAGACGSHTDCLSSSGCGGSRLPARGWRPRGHPCRRAAVQRGQLPHPAPASLRRHRGACGLRLGMAPMAIAAVVGDGSRAWVPGPRARARSRRSPRSTGSRSCLRRRRMAMMMPRMTMASRAPPATIRVLINAAWRCASGRLWQRRATLWQRRRLRC